MINVLVLQLSHKSFGSVCWLRRSYSGGTRLREKERKYSEFWDHTVQLLITIISNFCH